ncbi:flagellar motor protein MotB [Sphingomonas radiodurans]|uniref:flagellar motor protein MotB n=1 Tax=Sphingomonas radiodurans TaxID=2890321 RepID=UPI001E549BDC|nr:flagellar motor protein MotB [Sphingomonas radiodurans]WBH15641.1 OmpA family protein [Sphingomonas radiodurans]
MAARAPHGNNQPPKIIVKKIYIEGHGGHHGGAWKVAYADFVTAMMAFFLLMWLLGATTEKQRKGIADYFAPTILNTKSLGVGGSGLMGGQSVTSSQKTGTFDGNSRMPTIVSRTDGSGGPDMGTGKKGSLRSPTAIAAEDRKNFAKLKAKVEQQLQERKGLAALAKHIRFTMTPAGMRIDLVDDANYSMFSLGTTALESGASSLIGMVAEGIRPTQNPIMIRGHTDSLPFGDPRAMNNWMLATGRAETTRRRLAQGGIPENRFHRIEGVADREPMITADPMDPRNRRVAITLLYRPGSFGQ